MATPDATVTLRRPGRLGRGVATLFALSAAALSALALADSAWASGPGPSPGPLASLPSPPVQPDGAQPTIPAPTDGSPIDAATQQAANALAGANQNNVQNVVVIIRINSPGNDYVNQSNNAIANAVASNLAATNQALGSRGRSAAPAASPTPPVATPAQAEPPASTPPPATPPPAAPPAATPPRQDRIVVPAPARVRPSILLAHAAHRHSGQRTPASRQSAATTTHPAAAAGRTPDRGGPPPPASPEASASAPSPSSSSNAHGATPHRTSVTWAPARAVRAAAHAAGVVAARTVGSLRPSNVLPSVPAQQVGVITVAVLLTLIGGLLVFVLGIGASHLPAVRARLPR